MTKYTEAKKTANRAWDSKNLDRLSIAVPKGEKDKIKERALNLGESVNSYIYKLISEDIEKTR